VIRLEASAAKAAAGARLDREEALLLARDLPLHDLCGLGLAERTRRHGQDAFYVVNLHLNYTNVCANACRFCAFSRRAGDPDAVTLSLAEAREKLRAAAADLPVTEVHIVGGLNPELPFSHYLGLVALVKEELPGAAVKAFTAVEVAFLAQRESKSFASILSELRAAGLDALPGGGAEVFSPALRRRLCPEKVSAEVWLEVHRTAHALGLPTNATLLFGHIETWEDRVEHILALRALQDEAQDNGTGFLCFIPLAYQPGKNRLALEDGAKGPDGVDYLKTIALSRLLLDNVPHLKAYWAFAGIKAAQMALSAGADDFDGTIVREQVGHAAGADSPTGMTIATLCGHIEAAGFTPVERDTFFRPVPGA
jgi:aminodeoxyfutalosine synthase